MTIEDAAKLPVGAILSWARTRGMEGWNRHTVLTKVKFLRVTQKRVIVEYHLEAKAVDPKNLSLPNGPVVIDKVYPPLLVNQ